MNTSPLPSSFNQPGHALAARLLAATLGSYLLCVIFTLALQEILPPDWQYLLLSLPLPVCTATILWAFAARSAWQAWMALSAVSAFTACAMVAVALLR